MTIWLLALILTAIACATLYYASAGRTVNAGLSPADAASPHFRERLHSIDTDAALGRLGETEATAARGELAREIIQSQQAATTATPKRFRVWLPIVFVAGLSFATYGYLGSPNLPAVPFSSQNAASAEVDLETAVKAIEKRLGEAPDDLRGWKALGPAYMRLERFVDATRAFRRVIELEAPAADSLTDLGEALMMQRGGNVQGEPLELFRQAAAMDPLHVRSRYYVAGEETRTGDFEAAIRDWNELLALAKGDEPWVVTARNGIAFAQAGLHPDAPAPDNVQIDLMVDGLEGRLLGQGGSVEEWTQLVRSRMVQGRMDDAQNAYDAARKAFPAPADRVALDVLAADNGLVAR